MSNNQFFIAMSMTYLRILALICGRVILGSFSITVKEIKHYWVIEWIKQIMMYHRTRFELPITFHKE